MKRPATRTRRSGPEPRHARRSSIELWLAQFLRINQRWRRRDDLTIWHVKQIYRLDCQVLLAHGPSRRLVGFAALRTGYRWIADNQQQATG